MRNQLAKTRMIHARVDPELHESTAEIFSRIGISTTEAIRLFLKQVELHQGLPFSVKIPNAETVAAMKEANNPSKLKSYNSFRGLRDKL